MADLTYTGPTDKADLSTEVIVDGVSFPLGQSVSVSANVAALCKQMDGHTFKSKAEKSKVEKTSESTTEETKS